MPKWGPHKGSLPHFLGEVGILGLSLSLLGSSALILWGTYGVLVELPEAEDLVENRIDTQFLSLEGDRNPAVSICDERCGGQKLRPWEHNGGSTWLNPK